MDVVQSIVSKFGGVGGIVNRTGFPQQTVSSWTERKPPEIPPWRRPEFLRIADDADIALTRAERAYLLSSERRPVEKSRPDTQPEQTGIAA